MIRTKQEVEFLLVRRQGLSADAFSRGFDMPEHMLWRIGDDFIVKGAEIDRISERSTRPRRT